MPGNCQMGCFKPQPYLEKITPYSSVNYGFSFLAKIPDPKQVGCGTEKPAGLCPVCCRCCCCQCCCRVRSGRVRARAFTRRISMGTISSYVMQTDSHQATHDVYGEGSCPKFCFAVQTLALMTEPPFSPLRLPLPIPPLPSLPPSPLPIVVVVVVVILIFVVVFGVCRSVGSGRSGWVRLGRVGSGRVGSIRSGRIWSGRSARPGQSVWIRSDWVRSDQVRSDLVGPSRLKRWRGSKYTSQSAMVSIKR